ncbi:C13 family peptidase [Halioxenophilus sp. WMMB6]|uniref:C13 family peptidase n=1 Tax=Halioxenophilus sp. WMMB6 TaxID=3073815 RepID=UPI00295ECBAB|nr:C13 family peptidase [Halioxenophilus sp. WMMB6]
MIRNTLIALLATTSLYLLYINSVNQHLPPLYPADFILPDGSAYYGEIDQGLLTGQGKLVWPNGSHFEGLFVDGMFNGPGELWGADGSHYVGNFREGMFNGSGEYSNSDGNLYVGEWVNNLRHGQGKLSSPDGQVYEGEFVEGTIRKGHYSDTRGINYQGEFANWEFNGQGTFTTEDGDIYTGQFAEGSLTGQGTFTSSDGDHYQGEFENYYYQGQGNLQLANGDRYQGEFQYGQYHGQGVLTLAAEEQGYTELKGTWDYGRLENDPRYPNIDYSQAMEQALYNQAPLLQNELATVAPGISGKTELYFLGFAGYGSQDVFLKELTTIANIFNSPDYAQGRVLKLINNHQSMAETPLATSHALELALQALANKMNVDEDILFLYLTSHGSREHELSVRLNGISLPDLSAPRLAEIVNQSPIKWKVIFISACYSGGFIPELADDKTLVITAARSDRRSFGCSNTSDMTYFAKAYFMESLPKADNFINAFTLAEQTVTDWENRDFPDSKHSLPQIAIGSAIEQKLQAWRLANQQQFSKAH